MKSKDEEEIEDDILDNCNRCFSGNGRLPDRKSLGLEKAFSGGFRLIGSMMISMAGIMALAPVIANWIAPLILPFFRQMNMDPSIVSILMGNDMGGYQMAKSLAEDPQVGMMLGGITAGMFGGTLTFSIPLGFSLIQGDARKSFSKGMLIGIGCIPVGSIAGGLMLGIAPSKVLWNNIPVLFLTVLIVLGFVCMQDRLVKIMEIFGKIIEWTGTIGIGIGAFTYLDRNCGDSGNAAYYGYDADCVRNDRYDDRNVSCAGNIPKGFPVSAGSYWQSGRHGGRRMQWDHLYAGQCCTGISYVK